MKQSILVAACLVFSAVGFSQSAESAATTEKSKASCAKGKPACCAHAKKSCGDKANASNNDAPASSSNAGFNATEPKKQTSKADAKTTSAL